MSRKNNPFAALDSDEDADEEAEKEEFMQLAAPRLVVGGSNVLSPLTGPPTSTSLADLLTWLAS